MSRALNRGLGDCLARLEADGDRRLSARELAGIVSEVAQTLVGGSVPLGDSSRTELPGSDMRMESMADHDAALAALAGIVDGRLSELQHELDEIRAGMQEAAAKFLAIAEAIEDVAGHPDVDLDDQDQLYRSATAIYETSGFQDLGGQRLTRAADMLRHIELSVMQAQAALGKEGADQEAAALSDTVGRVETRKVEHILHGPQNAGTANTQEEIDKILASFD
jgi:hypothetical protein